MDKFDVYKKDIEAISEEIRAQVKQAITTEIDAIVLYRAS